MNTKEKNALIYHSAYQYLIEILPYSLSENDLEKYFWGDKKDFSSLNDVFEQMIHSTQNYQRMPNVIKFQERREKIKNILFDFDAKKIVETYEIEELYKIFRKEFNITSADNKFNSWHKWSKSIIDSAKFLSEFKNVDDFKGFVGQFDYNVHTRMALPLLISEKISGMGFALACDFLKELGYINYPKPDVHLIDVFHDVGLSDKDPLSVFEAIVKMSEYCKEFFKNENITPYQIDKIIWLICSGKFYYEGISVGQHKKELIQLLQENIKNIKRMPRPDLGTCINMKENKEILPDSDYKPTNFAEFDKVKKYKYCTVVPKFCPRDFYYYLDFSGKVKRGTFVIAPFGDDEIIGKVTRTEFYEKEKVPFPIDKMKSIRRIISKEEYDEYTYAEYIGADESERYELFELDRVLIKNTKEIGTILSKFWYDEAKEYLYKVEPDGDFDSGWEFKAYSCYELEKYDVLGRLKYIGKNIYNDLVNNGVYNVIGVVEFNGKLMVRVVTDGDCIVLLNWENPANPQYSEFCGKWEIVEDIDRKFSYALENPDYGPKSVLGDD